MVLAKADLGVARRYADLVPDRALAESVFAAIEDEWTRTVEALARITGNTERLADNPTLARSIAHRFAYIAPLNQLPLLPSSPGGFEGSWSCRTYPSAKVELFEKKTNRWD